MNLHQFRFVQEAARRNLNLTEAAKALHTSQPGVSKAIIELEEELGVDIFARHGKRLKRITEPGQEVLKSIELIMREVGNLKRIGEQYSAQDSGTLSIATTHTQARYALPRAVKAFLARYPQVRLSLKQGSPTQISEMVVNGEADLAIATEGISLYPELAMLPCFEWNRSVVVPNGHPLTHLTHPVTLEDIAAWPIVTYDFAFAGRSQINQAFAARNLDPMVALSAIDTDVIKAYVALGLGVGLIASMAYDPEKDYELTAIDASHLFEPSMTRIGIRKDAYLRGYVYDFIELFAPHLTRDKVQSALMCEDI